MREFSWEKFVDILDNDNGQKPNDSEINTIRNEIYKQCRESACSPKGFFKLYAPTGGGKTLSGMRFAAGHAKVHKMDRIIYVLPYISIIEQNAKVFKELFDKYLLDKELILESHSNIVNESIKTQKDNLAEDNIYKELPKWDKPIIFTTMVQFLENVYGGGTEGIRKMHYLANSVLIFDEIQALPDKCLYLFNSLVRFLTDFCGASVVFCSATQLPLHSVSDTDMQLPQGAEIVTKRYPQLDNRVKYIDKTESGAGRKLSNAEIAALAKEQLKKAGNLLIVVNTKKTAENIYLLLKNTCKTFYLSTNLCAQHRSDIIEDIKKRLANKEEIICVSTNLIEAGVDVDFNSVIRLSAGLDNIIQCAGRCNRNGGAVRGGGQQAVGEVVIVSSKEENLQNLQNIKEGQNRTSALLVFWKKGKFEKLTSDEAMSEYYNLKLNGLGKTPEYPVLGSTTQIDLLTSNRQSTEQYKSSGKQPKGLRAAFKTAASHFKVIEQNQISVIVPYDKGKEIIKDIQNNIYTSLGQSQRYTVNLYSNSLKSYSMALAELENGLAYIREGYYDNDLGVIKENMADKNIL